MSSLPFLCSEANSLTVTYCHEKEDAYRAFPYVSNTATTSPSSFSLFRHLLSSLHSSSKNIVPFSAPAFADSDDEDTLDLPRSSVLHPLHVTPGLLIPRVMVYDGVCNLCHRDVKWVISTDKDQKIKFCCVQSKTAEPYLTACGLKKKKDVLHRLLFVEGLGSYSQGSTAALRVLSYLPLPYSALSLLLVVPRLIRDAVYDYITKHQYEWFGRTEACLVLEEKEDAKQSCQKETKLNTVLVEQNRGGRRKMDEWTADEAYGAC